MNRVLVIVGAVLLTLSLCSFAFLPYTWTEETTATITTPIVDVDLPARQTHTVSVRPELNWAAAGVGWLLIIVGVSLGGRESGSTRG